MSTNHMGIMTDYIIALVATILFRYSFEDKVDSCKRSGRTGKESKWQLDKIELKFKHFSHILFDLRDLLFPTFTLMKLHLLLEADIDIYFGEMNEKAFTVTNT